MINAVNHGTDWRGNYVAVVTPFTQTGELDEHALVANLELLFDEGADGFVVAGCTGESWAMTPAERIRVAELAVSAVGAHVPVIAGVSDIRTEDVVAAAREARRAGAAGVLVLPPYFALPGPAEVVAHYRAISDGAAIPIMIYNNPRRTGINLQPELLQQLADIEWVVAVKESSSDYVQTERTIRELADRVAVFTGHSAERGAAAVLMGAHGFVSSLEPQIMGRRAIELYDTAAAGDFDQARAIQFETLAVQDGLARCGGTAPANLKAAMNLLGRPGGYPRRPILPLTDAEMERLRSWLEASGMLSAQQVPA